MSEMFFQGTKRPGASGCSRARGLTLAGWGFQEGWRFQNPRVSGKIYNTISSRCEAIAVCQIWPWTSAPLSLSTACGVIFISHICLYLADIADGSLEYSGGGMFLIPLVSRNINFESSLFSSCRVIAPNILRFLFVTEVCAVALKTWIVRSHGFGSPKKIYCHKNLPFLWLKSGFGFV